MGRHLDPAAAVNDALQRRLPEIKRASERYAIRTFQVGPLRGETWIVEDREGILHLIEEVTDARDGERWLAEQEAAEEEDVEPGPPLGSDDTEANRRGDYWDEADLNEAEWVDERGNEQEPY